MRWSGGTEPSGMLAVFGVGKKMCFQMKIELDGTNPDFIIFN